VDKIFSFISSVIITGYEMEEYLPDAFVEALVYCMNDAIGDHYPSII
jgi:hypothetical protein